MIKLTVEEAAKAGGCRITGEYDKGALINTFVIDSRKVSPGDMFVAYKGDKTDGHRFIGTAFEAGASCCLASYVPDNIKGAVLVSDDVQDSLEAIAEKYRSRLEIPIVGITGSVGKTTTKEMVSSVLQEAFNIYKTEGNLNNTIGVPITLSNISEKNDAAVVEMGINHFGEMTHLSKMVKPQIAVFTNIGHAHLEFLNDLDGVFSAKTEMLAYMPDDGVIVANGDDEKLKAIKSPLRTVFYGMNEGNDVRAVNIRLNEEHWEECDIICGGSEFHCVIPGCGNHLVYAALAGAAVGFALGMTAESIRQGILNYAPVGRRGQVSDNGFIVVIDDCYNANPDSMRSSITSLMSFTGRKLCILADMLEMGSESEIMHYELGVFAAEKGVDKVITTGRFGKAIAEGAGDKGIWYETPEQLTAALPELIREGDCVLVKASNGMHMGPVADTLKTMKKPAV